MYYKARVNNLAPSSLDAPIFVITRDEKVNGEWKQVECTESHVLEGKLTRVFYASQDKYPKLNLWFLMDDGNTVIYKTSMGKTIRNLLYKLSAPEKIDRVTLKANWFDGKDKDGNTQVIRYIAVFVDGQKWDNPFDKDDKRIKPIDVQSNGKHFAYDWTNVDQFIFTELIPQINDKLVNKYEKKEESVEIKERPHEDPESCLPF